MDVHMLVEGLRVPEERHDEIAALVAGELYKTRGDERLTELGLRVQGLLRAVVRYLQIYRVVEAVRDEELRGPLQAIKEHVEAANVDAAVTILEGLISGQKNGESDRAAW